MIGSGPAGLAAAQQLTRAGHTVAVYERADKIGGLLRYGIPEFKMEKKHLDRRLDQMRREGTVFRAGVDVGDELTAESLRDRYDAVVLAMGATDAARPAGPRPRARRHPPGDGVPAAVQPRLARRGGRPSQITAAGKDVVIIGGGDTGADCLGTATRQGARSITQLEIMPEPPAGAPGRPAVADVPDDLPGLLGARGGRRAGLLGLDQGVPRRRRRARRGRCAWSRWTSRTASSRRSRAPSARSRPSWCSSRWASSAPRSRAWSSSSASTSTSAATSPATRRT